MSEHPSETRERAGNPAAKQRLRADSHAMDGAGEALIIMLNEAALLSNQSRDRVTDLVDDLSKRLAALEDRIHQLQGDAEHFRGRALGAEKWLTFIQKEIEETLIMPMTEIRHEQVPPH
jgi:hypothetical protein